MWSLLARTYGAWWTPDTLTYLTGAEALRNGTLHTALHFRPFVEPYPALTGWPPGYPALLAPLLALGWAPTTATLVVSGGCFVATHVLLAIALQRVTQRAEAGLLALFLLAFGPMLEIGLRGWSEGPWTVVLLLLIGVLTHEPSRARATTAGLLSSALFLLRHASLVMLPLTLLFVAWTSRSWRRTAATLGVQLLATGPWLVYSVATSGRVGFAYPAADTPFSTVLWSLGEGLLGSFASPATEVFAVWPVAVMLAAVAALGVGFLGLQRNTTPPISSLIPVWVGLCGLAHTSAYLLLRRNHYLDDPDGRILFPLTFAVVFAALVFLGRHLRAGRAPLFAGVALAWSTLIVAHHVAHPSPPFDWVRLERYAARMAWIEAHTDRDDLVLGPPCMVTHFLTGRATLGTIWPPYGEPFERPELDDLVRRWPGRVVFVLTDRERARTSEAGTWTIADHPEARPLEPRGPGFTVWTVERPRGIRQRR